VESEILDNGPLAGDARIHHESFAHITADPPSLLRAKRQKSAQAKTRIADIVLEYRRFGILGEHGQLGRYGTCP